MRHVPDDNSLLLAPGDLNAHLACRRLTTLKRAVARGEIEKPYNPPDPHLELIRDRGFAHEEQHLALLRARHGDDAVVTIDTPDWEGGITAIEAAATQTADAMRAGAPLIFQAAFHDGRWHGYADFLVRVDRPSELGDYSYEVVDTKLARSFKATFAHQLTRYSLHVAAIQGLVPVHAHVVLGTGETETFRIDDVLAVHRRAADRLEAAIADEESTFEPEMVAHCDLCDFSRDCRKLLRERDDLAFVATLARDHRAKLHDIGVETLAALSELAPDAPRGALSETTFERVRVQAELQRLTRETGELQRRHLPAERARGYARLPTPSPGDVFFDLEGNPFIGDEGIEYLWGYEILNAPGEPEYVAIWAHDEAEERAAFEAFVDFVVARRAEHPGLHVFHYAPHEVSTLRRLAQKYATREAEIDTFLRDGVLVDLFAVVRQGIQVGQESYSIKKLEAFYGYERTSDVREGGGSIVAYERWVESGDDAILDEIALYNHEDCTSTRLLRDWLLQMRDAAAAEQGVDFDELRDPEPEEPATDPDWVADVQALQDALEAPLPEEAEDEPADVAARRLLARLLFYHRRDGKPEYWRHHALRKMSEIELEDEPDAIAGLVPDGEPFTVRKSFGTWLRFPAQEHRLREGEVVDPSTGDRAGSIEGIEPDRVLLVRGKKAQQEQPYPRALIGPQPIPTTHQRGAIVRVAEALRDGTSAYPAVTSLLRRDLPVVDGVAHGTPLVDGHVTEEEATRVTLGLRESYLPVQGPPGAGKTYTGARMIVAALDAGLRVAVAAGNHKAIHNLVREVEKVADERGVHLAGLHKHSSSNPSSVYESKLELVGSTDDNREVADPALNLVSGTPWCFSRPEHDQAFDLLVIDEAGQLSLADAVAMGTCARSIVLLGDPQQLPQVSQGTHPPGADASVLEHVLAGHDAIAPERGLFLDESWRMHSDITAFVSERFYEGRLTSVDGCGPQRVIAPQSRLDGAGLRLLEIEHDGRSQSSPEEAAAIARACNELLAGSRVVLREDGERELRADDIMVVAPYNLAVREIADAVPKGVRVGTVDLFQGQEAPVVFYAMTSSTGADPPRGLGFLFQPNRLNVAISRAQCLAVLVCSTRLMDAECGTLEQLRMVNHVCRFGEMARWTGGAT